MESTHGDTNSLYKPEIWKRDLDKSSTFYNVVQISPDNNTLSQIASTGGGPIVFRLQKSQAYILLAHNDTCLRFKIQYGCLQNGLPYRFADIAPESNLASMMIAKISLRINGKSITDYSSGFFNIQHEVENHMEPLEFRLKSGEEQGFIPDVNSGMAESIQCAYLTLVPTANIANGASGQFGVYITNNTGTAIAATAANINSPYYYSIPGTNLQIPLIIPAVIQPNNSAVCAIATPFNLVANAAAPWAFGCTTLMLISTAAVNASTGPLPTSCYIQLFNTTGATLLGYTAATFQPATVPANVYNQLASIPFPLNVGYNPLYEPGYVRRKLYYNYNPNSSINANNLMNSNLADNTWRFLDIKFPLNRLSRFCKDYQSVLAGVDIEVNLFMSNYVATVPSVTIAPFNTAAPNSVTSNGLNAIFGQPNAQMIIQMSSVRMDYVTFTPAPSTLMHLNKHLSSKFEVTYTDCVCAKVPNNYTISNQAIITQMQLDVKKRMCYLILVFKNTNVNSSTQNYGGFVNANINAVTVQYGKGGNMLFPAQPQNDDFTNMGNSTYCSGPKHFYGQYRNLFQRWHANPEIPMSETEFRNLYTMYCFDLTDLNDMDKDTDSSIYVSISRIPNTNNEGTAFFENYYLLYYQRTATFDFTQTYPIVTIDQ